MWEVRLLPRAEKAMRKLDRVAARRVRDVLVRLSALDDPTKPCKALTGPLVGYWRIRVGDYRVIMDVQRDQLVILALDVGHRSCAYDD